MASPSRSRIPADRPLRADHARLEDPGPARSWSSPFSDIYRTDARLARWREDPRTEDRLSTGAGPRRRHAAHPARSVLPSRSRPGDGPALRHPARWPDPAGGRQGDGTSALRPARRRVRRADRGSTEGVLVFDGSIDDERDLATPRRGLEHGLVRAAFPDAPGMHPEVQGVPSGPDWSKHPRPGRSRWLDLHGQRRASSRSGTRTTARWRDGKAEVLGREVSTLIPRSFLTPDGQLWNADNGVLRRFVDGRWVHVGDRDWPPRAASTTGTASDCAGRRQRRRPALDPSRPPRMRSCSACPMAPSSRPRGWRSSCSPKPTRNSARGPRRDPVGEGRAAAGDRPRPADLRDRRRRPLHAASLNTGGRSVSRLARDGRGRLWLGGEGLAVLDADGKTLHPLDELPMIGRSHDRGPRRRPGPSRRRHRGHQGARRGVRAGRPGSLTVASSSLGGRSFVRALDLIRLAHRPALPNPPNTGARRGSWPGGPGRGSESFADSAFSRQVAPHAGLSLLVTCIPGTRMRPGGEYGARRGGRPRPSPAAGPSRGRIP